MKVRFEPGGAEVEVPRGITVMEAAVRAGLSVDAPCGGRGRCGKCRVRIVSVAGAAEATELQHLTTDEITAGMRLACVHRLTSDAVVETPSALFGNLTGGSLTVGNPIAGSLTAGIHTARRVSWSFDSADRKGHVLIASRRPDPYVERVPSWTGAFLGVAADIGTTTIACYLWDLTDGRLLGSVSVANPQAIHGADVMSRISYAASGRSALDTLRREAIEAVNNLVRKVTCSAGASPADVFELTVVGNTCMHHLFLGLDPAQLGSYPYIPSVTEPLVLRPGQVGVDINPAGAVLVLPNVAGYVGADAVGMMLALDLDTLPGTTLAVDVGTNTEISLARNGRIVACSAAAGPAFEGGHISSGVRAGPGAIDRAWVVHDPLRTAPQLEFRVIGGGKPAGICGSGLVDLVAEFLRLGLVSGRGEIVTHRLGPQPAPLPLRERVVQHQGAKAVLVAGSDVTDHGRPILLTQKDVREFQLAKGAILAGVKILMRRMGVSEGQVDRVMLAGAFGNYLDPGNACVAGLLPLSLASKVIPVGNAAGAGASAAMLSREEFERAGSIARSVEYVELAAEPDFADVFTACVDFGTPLDIGG